MISIKNLFHINAPKEKVYKAISTIDGLSNWWTTETTGESNVDGTIQFRFGRQGPDMKVTELIPNESVTWEGVGGPEEWLGNTFTFKLDENEGKTRVRFEHAGWKEANDFFASCSFSWGRYMESLLQYCQTGNGEAFGSEGYRK
jgi:uncharacterized protein YndB with AHSA1/START domain